VTGDVVKKWLSVPRHYPDIRV